MRKAQKKRRSLQKWLSAVIVVCALTICACVGYIVYENIVFPHRIASENRSYAAMYRPAPSAAARPSVSPEATTTAEPAYSPAPVFTPAPSPTAKPTPDAAEIPSDVVRGTIGPDTLVVTADEPPEPQDSFGDLLSFNPDTVAFLRMGDDIALPVAMRRGDNEYYLTHTFDGDEARNGCLFVDGMNMLYPRDDCLYVYGHNMKNGTMFGPLDKLATRQGLIDYSPAYFDTIYENGVYVPFACVVLNSNDKSVNYFDLRRFVFDESSFDEYVSELKTRSRVNIPVDVEYGDELLVLVTCNYSINDGRFAIAYRKVRDGESIDDLMRVIATSHVRW